MIKWTGVLAIAFSLVLTQVAVAQSSEDDPAQVEAGMAVFEANCASCHSSDGSGSATGRPLTDVATEAERATHIASVTDGKGGMPAFGPALSAEEIASAVSYVRLTFVSEAQPAEETAEESFPVTGAETWPLLIAAVTFGAAGLMLLSTRRRFDAT